MNPIKRARALFLAIALLLPLAAFSEVAVPTLTTRVTDLTATLTPDQKDTLEQKLRAFEARKGSQVSVLIVPGTQPETIEQYSLRVVEQWKLGRKRVDDGALLIVAKDDRNLRIEVGYGLEGILTDATSKRIISEDIVPRFKQGDFYGGIVAGIDRMLQVINGEPLPPAKATAGGERDPIRQYMPIVLMLTLVLGGVLRSALGRFPGAVAAGAAIGVVAWLFSGTILVALVAGVIALSFTLLGGGMGAHVGAWSIGGRSGGSSGGFGGGGGGFGGGGASGRW
ncbi:TPM domain-containing protein [Cupriavidus basilensis]|uniref:TPM domain-containing protein n=1 Tax=Cupriavidus basilensis TaxID=68895 RepID=UPI0039F6A417